jgi:uncharacterized membrane protein
MVKHLLISNEKHGLFVYWIDFYNSEQAFNFIPTMCLAQQLFLNQFFPTIFFIYKIQTIVFASIPVHFFLTLQCSIN